MDKPIILIAGEDGYDDSSHAPHFVAAKKYAKAIRMAGGLAVMAMDFRTIPEYLQLAQGLLLAEGPRIHPACSGQFLLSFADLQGVSTGRDWMEIALCRQFLLAGKPVLGIGRGACILQIVKKDCGGREDFPPDAPAFGTACSEELFLPGNPLFSSFVSRCGKGGEAS